MTLVYAPRLVLAVLAIALASCEGTEASLRGAYFESTINGDFALAGSSGPPNLGARQNDIEDAFGVDDSAASPYLRGDVTGEFGRVLLSGFYYDQTGRGTLTGDYGDIAAGTTVNSELTFWNIRAAWAYDLVELGPVRFSPGLSLDTFNTTMAARNPANGAFEEVEAFGAVPMLYASAGLDLWIVEAAIDVGWMSIDLPDADGTYWDVDAMVIVSPFENLDIFAGYRFMHLEADGETDGRLFDTNLRIDGFYAGLGWTF